MSLLPSEPWDPFLRILGCFSPYAPHSPWAPVALPPGTVLAPHSRLSSHTNTLAVFSACPAKCPAHSCLRNFELTIPSVWNILPQRSTQHTSNNSSGFAQMASSQNVFLRCPLFKILPPSCLSLIYFLLLYHTNIILHTCIYNL